MNKPLMHSKDMTADNVSKIAALFPNCVTEHKDAEGNTVQGIDFEKLQQELSSDLIQTGEERYQFTWPGKMAAIREANRPTNCALRPDLDSSEDFWNTQNLYIEGDNLEVLKLLQENYLGKVKMIYIDPPYNTGNEFVYNDDFAESSTEFAEKAGMFDEDGNMLLQNYEKNSESNGRFHTDWLNMMYPRLRCARNLLTENGLIFISIDDHEVHNLKKICDDVFGSRNFITCVTRATGTPTGGGFEGFVNELDYMLIYAKNINETKTNGLQMTEEDSKIYDREDEYGRYLCRSLRRTGGEDRREDRPTMFFPIIAPDGTEVYPMGPTGYESRWICSPATVKQMIDNHLIEWKKSVKDGKTSWTVYQKFYLENRTKAPGNLWNDVEGNKKATRDVRNIFDTKKVFDFPKPVGFMEKILAIGSDKDSIVLDFFSGSATTAHATMKMNASDGGSRRFILVQLPEAPEDGTEAQKSGYTSICQIGEERIRRAGKKIKEDSPLTTQHLDTGFRVLKLDSSNMKDIYYTPKDTQNADLYDAVCNIKLDRTPMDLLFQVMLEKDIPLSAKIEQKEMSGKTVFFVEDNYLVATFDDDITEDLVKEIAKMQPYNFVMANTSYATDSLVDNFEQIFKVYSPETACDIL